MRGKDQAQLLVDDVLERIKDSDSGSALSKEEQSEVNDRLDELETFSDKKPLDDERIYGSYNVTYVSAGKSEKSNPAGGRFRGKLGKSLFRTTVLEQNVYEPDIILNKVGFRLFGIIPGEVTLKGTIEPEPADQRATVRAKFGSPKIKLGFVTLSFGPKSSVVLTTTYLDDRVRLGKGSRGSYFIFTRFSPTESSVDETPGSPLWKVAVTLAAVGGLAWGACTKLAIPPVWAAAAVFCVTLALALVLRNGGIVDEENRLSPASTGGD
ncbi:hypothetical protein CYMTET_43732 [Cymbomonas tetramitiformis]|uniref:Plastid lipid-associated protein/fibrillin conserved domain-containing protein n=1 Tax=Cymbomonas tetramitiformis TaxID=36881 RepID=A0AAE0C3N2_9CHLO|nr:hypothetical protein CYMTET_43732 [Cymbomonas tetramitiformis]